MFLHILFFIGFIVLIVLGINCISTHFGLSIFLFIGSALGIGMCITDIVLWIEEKEEGK